jgi:flagellar protein FliO/FliZ
MRWIGLILTFCLFSGHAKAEDSMAKELLATEAVTAPLKADLSLPSKAEAGESTVLLSPTATSVPEAKEPAKENLKESEITLNLDKTKKSAEGESSVYRLLFSLVLLGVVGVGAFFYLRKYAIPKAMKSQTQIKILQQHYLGPKKSLAIIRVAGESLLIGITDQNINMIKSLSLIDDEVPEETPQNFAGAMRGFDSTTASSGKMTTQQDGEDFSFGSIKDIVAKRLKGMRSLE